MFRRLDDRSLVAGQLHPEDIAALASQGVTMVVNNRPDGEEPGQPEGSVIEDAARNAGLDYVHIPVSGGLSPAQVSATAQVLEKATGQTLLFCRSGTRSAYLWAFARASRGAEPDQLITAAAACGYDLSSLRRHLQAVGEGARSDREEL
jgi:uncharacterized protein (TIGR01244 family)